MSNETNNMSFDAIGDKFSAKKWFKFCGFNASADTFVKRFIYSEAKHLATPCAEFAFITIDHFIFLFFIVLGFFHIKNSTRIPSNRIRYIIVFRLFVTLATCIILIGSIFLSLIVSSAKLPAVILIEYGLVMVVWCFYAIVWAQTLHYNAWTRPFGMSIAYGITSKTFIIVFVHRCLQYGVIDLRAAPILALLVLHIANIVFGVIEFFISKRYLNSSQLPDSEDTISPPFDDEADEGANFISKTFFWWTNELVKQGYRGEIKQIAEDLFKLPPSLRIARVEREFFEAAPTQFTDSRPFSFAHALVRAYGVGYALLGVQSLVSDCLKFAGPVLLHLLISSVERGGEDHFGFIYSSLMLATALVSSILSSSYIFYVRKISLKVRCALLTAVYDKLLQIPAYRLVAFSTGQLINFMSTDVDRIAEFCTSFHAVWSMPLNLAISLYLLYREVGWAFIAGLAAALITIPINKCIANKIGDMSTKMMHYKDLRMRIVTETARAIRTVKLNNWEGFFAEKIERIRAHELRYLRARKYLDAVCVYLWASAPILITIAILTTYTAVLGERLTAAKVFTSLALVNILIIPLNAFPWVLNSLIEAVVSKRRFDRFFSIENLDLFSMYGLTEVPKCRLEVNNAKFSWNSSQFTVGNVSLRASKGQLVGVVGPVGSGKSTLLFGLLGETMAHTDGTTSGGKPMRVGSTALAEGFAYVGQDCWLRRGSIRENIVCGDVWRAEFYADVLRATALDYDIELMPNKDDYLIGDEGATLSGGQRARLALARAIYQDNDVVLLDDPFASLDASVAEFVYENAIEKMLRARAKTIILCTHHIQYLLRADLVLCLNSYGTVRSQGIPQEVLSSTADSISSSITINTGSAVSKEGTIAEATSFYNAEPVASATSLDEAKEEGTVKMGVYGMYLRSVGAILSALILGALFAMQLSKNASDVWLSRWTLNESSAFSNDSESIDRFHNAIKSNRSYLFGLREMTEFVDVADYERTVYFLTVYVCIALANTVFTLIRAFFFAYGGVVAAEKLHRRLLYRVLESTISWWDNTPWGRVVNRLCADVYTVDDSLPFQLNICLASLFNLLGALFITILALPFLTPLVAILFVLYYFIQRYYRFANCDIKRIASLTLSPLYSHITDTVTGLVTIRAHRFTERFTKMLRERLDRNLRAQYSALAASQWLAIRLQLLGVIMVSSVAYTGVLESRYLSMESGLIALAMTYALSLTNILSSLLTSFIDTERELVSVERVADYIANIPKEETTPHVEHIDKFLFCRAIKGQIDFTCVSMRYGNDLPLALRNVTFRVDAGQRIAIVGRTGAGKSSIFQALLRAQPIETGRIFVDGTVDLLKMDPRAVRSMFGYVSQAPFIFSGSIRENLTMNNTESPSSDAAICAVISAAGLSEWLECSGGLDAEVVEGGRNFSFGEKQILAVCRLILARPKIVLIDEGTAHMDEVNHLAMMNLIRSQLPDSTLIAIMHRTAGLDQFDWIIEMSEGAIHRQGRPTDFQRFVE